MTASLTTPIQIPENALTTEFPAEWAPQSGIMLTWPHQDTDWKDDFDAVEDTYLQIASAILHDQNLLLSCEDEALLSAACEKLHQVASEHNTRVMPYVVPADDTWARDHGPIGILRNNSPALLDFTFNAWGGKFGSSKDNMINQRLNEQQAFGDTALHSLDFVLEGGSIESNGVGTLLTTEHCLLQATRNQTLGKHEIEDALKAILGIKQVLWLSAGFLEGDDTDAHIDTLARFVAADTICYVSCDDPQDVHYAPLQQMKQQLESFRDLKGKPFKLIALPMPEAIYNEVVVRESGQTVKERLPATYANFLITNRSILLPVYQVPQDQEAIAIMRRCFPTRTIVPINCCALIRQHGSLHCVTMQLLKGICE